MRISFERSGGFAGIIRTTNIDTATLPPNECKQVSELIQSASFLNYRKQSLQIHEEAIAFNIH
jgi:hypothetical protein